MGFLQFIGFFMWNITLVPLLVLITKPFHSIDNQKYCEYFIKQCKIKQRISCDQSLIEQGYILANHRSWFDSPFDAFMTKASVLGRREAFLAVFFSSCLGYLDNRIISFTRGKETRQELFTRIKEHMNHTEYKRILFWPEGTRLKHIHLESAEDAKSYFKFGLLKCIYEDKQFPVQLQISNNKELVLDEKRFHIQYGVSVNTHRSKSIHPKDFATEDLFYDEIAKVWYECWKITHEAVQ
jgi:hypothetical protein